MCNPGKRKAGVTPIQAQVLKKRAETSKFKQLPLKSTRTSFGMSGVIELDNDDEKASEKAKAVLPDVRAVENQCIVAEFLCSISCQLPIDPVLALDGKVYDREYITDWFTRNPGDTCKSPMTNKPIKKTLVAATQIKSTIALLIDRGIIANKETEEWKRAVKEQEGWSAEFKNAMYEASGGVTQQMSHVGDCYRDGVGTTMNKEKAIKWYTKASLLGHVCASVSLGVMYTNGVEGIHQGAKQPARGILELSRAAALGSEHACCILADWLGGSNAGLLHPDPAAATFWYKSSLDCRFKDSVFNSREKRVKWLREHAS